MEISSTEIGQMDGLVQPGVQEKTCLFIVQPTKTSSLHVPMWTHLGLTPFCDTHWSWIFSCCPFCHIFLTFFVFVLPCIGCYLKNAGVYLRVWLTNYLQVTHTSLFEKLWSWCHFNLHNFFINNFFFQACNCNFLGGFLVSALLQPVIELSPDFNNKWYQTIRIHLNNVK